VQVSAVLGRATMQVSQLLKLGRGAVVELDRKLGEAVDIYVNNRLVARGDVVMVEDNRLGVGPMTRREGGAELSHGRLLIIGALGRSSGQAARIARARGAVAQVEGVAAWLALRGRRRPGAVRPGARRGWLERSGGGAIAWPVVACGGPEPRPRLRAIRAGAGFLPLPPSRLIAAHAGGGRRDRARGAGPPRPPWPGAGRAGSSPARCRHPHHRRERHRARRCWRATPRPQPPRAGPSWR
jgi:flagellar motor switch protein FliN